ncbi:DNA translocase FtsK [Oscillospiraceae bacterium LTW-04]|nr:DNA translocase FtsK [Oscillospiraceae bacterium MB24-C1]
MAAKRKKKSPRKTKAQLHAQNQLLAVVLFTLGLLFVFLSFVRGSEGWLMAHNVLLGLFGWSAFFIGPVFLYISVMSSFDKLSDDLPIRATLTAVLLCLISAAFQIFLAGKPEGQTVGAVIRQLYVDGQALHGGGIFAVLFGLPLMQLGAPGDRIAVSLLLFLLTMIITKSTIAGILRSAKKPMEKLSNGYHELVNAMPAPQPIGGNSTLAEKPVIDIPLDDPAPASRRRKKPVAEEGVSSELLRAKQKLLDTATADMPISEDHPVTPNGDPVAPVVPDEEGQQLIIEDIINRVAKVQAHKAQKAVEEASAPEPPAPPPEPVEPPVYLLPPLTLLREPALAAAGEVTADELRQNAQRLVDTLQSFGVQTRIIDISRGPAVTRYELQPSAGVKISKITNLADDIALNLASAGVRIEAPIPNKAAVGIEVPNRKVTPVTLREVVDSPEFADAKSKVTVALGRDISGNLMLANIAKMPHLLIAGATGSGKSVCINSIIMSILFKAKPDEVKLLLIDPKVVELGVYNGLPHLVIPVVTDPKKAAGALGWAVAEMLNRYKMFAAHNVRDIESFNRFVENAAANPTPPAEDEPPAPKLSKLPHYIIVVDELADLMMAAPSEVEDSICRLAQMARAAGMHLIIATQRPSVDVITGVIKANIPSRIAFAVSSQIDSRTILDMGGAEKLLGMGDMLFSPVGSAKPTRVQGCFVSDEEIERVVTYINSAITPQYDNQVLEEIDKHTPVGKGNASGASSDSGGDEDEMLAPAIECVIEAGMASTSLLQRRLKLGYARAARIVDEMESRGIIGPYEGSKPRAVLISKERWVEMKLNRMAKTGE